MVEPSRRAPRPSSPSSEPVADGRHLPDGRRDAPPARVDRPDAVAYAESMNRHVARRCRDERGRREALLVAADLLAVSVGIPLRGRHDVIGIVGLASAWLHDRTVGLTAVIRVGATDTAAHATASGRPGRFAIDHHPSASTVGQLLAHRSTAPTVCTRPVGHPHRVLGAAGVAVGQLRIRRRAVRPRRSRFARARPGLSHGRHPVHPARLTLVLGRALGLRRATTGCDHHHEHPAHHGGEYRSVRLGVRMQTMRVVLLVALLSSCGPVQHPPDESGGPGDRQEKSGDTGATPCGSGTCDPGSICVPGGTSSNGIGETVELPPEHCAPLPAACNGVASCPCVDPLCPIGGCTSVDSGRLICVAG